MGRYLVAVLVGALCTMALVGGCGTLPTSSSNDNSREAIDNDAIKLRQTASGAVLTFQDMVLFDTAQSDLRPESSPILDKLASILIHKSKSQIVIEGHTDNQGGALFNLQLSEARAKSVRSALLARHVETSRLKVKGAGFSQPIVSNDTATGRQRNRRVEVVMVGEKVDALTKGNANSLDFTPELKNFYGHARDSIKKTWNAVVDTVPGAAGKIFGAKQ